MSQRLFLAFCLSAASIACGGNDGPTAPSSQSNFDGEWSGTTTDGSTITFLVSSKQVKTITIAYSLGSSCSGSKTFPNLSIPIVDNPRGPTTPEMPAIFIFRLGSLGSPNYVQVTGQFPSMTTADGTLILDDEPACGFFILGLWTATKR